MPFVLSMRPSKGSSWSLVCVEDGWLRHRHGSNDTAVKSIMMRVVWKGNVKLMELMQNIVTQQSSVVDREWAKKIEPSLVARIW
ncbi:hypothetical protein PC117_g18706 [Phytophthora cactorum]|uniref:Uncharacterized protein n=1 Tax=Phytophthora cactorum TaxID=29920 RepID=A0A8T1C1Z3_9STRA|nr:hypothetical protein PC117_g18706 [Phytophthora cactorum]